MDVAILFTHCSSSELMVDEIVEFLIFIFLVISVVSFTDI